MKSVTSKFKFFICATLVLLLAGMAVLGFIGFNEGVDYTKSYEIKVEVDQDVNGAAAKIKQYAEEYFADKGVKDNAYGYQAMDEGNMHLYKFDTATEIDQDQFKAHLEEKLNNDKVFVDVQVNEVVTGAKIQTLNIVLALAIAAVAIFVYLLFMAKVASALSIVAVSVVATITFTALIALVRIPALPYFEVGASIAFVLSMIFATVMASRFSEEQKNVANATLTVKEIADKSAVSSIKRFATLFVAVLLVAVLFALLGKGYLLFLGLQLIVADVSAACVAFFATPTLWTALKTEKKGYNK